MNVMGCGPINERLDAFHKAMWIRGRRVVFGRDKNVNAIKKLYEWLQEARVIPVEVTQNAKSNKKSKQLRLKGNVLFASDTDLSKALELYNESICWAEDTGEELAIGFANRSAVYYEWEMYEACIENIDLAVKAGCPERLKDKLGQRIDSCVKCLSKIPEKEDAEPWTPKYIDNLVLKTKDLSRLKSKHFCFDVDQNRSEPELSLTPHPTIPFIAKCLEMKPTSYGGRSIFTTQELQPGQIISIEEPFINAMEKEHRYRKCGNCFAENFLNLIPCKSCTCTMFCSQECLRESEKGFHQYECPIAEYVWNHCQEIALTFRLVVKAFSLFDTVQELSEFREKNKAADDVTAFSFDHTMDLSDTERYSQIEHLYTNEEKRPHEDMFIRGCKVALLYHFLMARTKFGEMLKTESERDTLISLILQHSQVTSINSFNCYQYDDVELDAVKECKSSDIFARGMYPLSSLFNHSCAPNIATITVGMKIVSYVTRCIKKNGEVLGCLKRLYSYQCSRNERQYLLKAIYGFVCNCEACQNDYPSVHEERLSFGFENEQIKNTVDAITFNLNEDVEQINKFCTILRKHGRSYPTGALYDIGWRLHRAMVLKYGNLASQLQISMKKNQSKFSAVFKK